ncbi:MAG: hypothetical protein ABEI13_02510, partial [Candidatus Paceibacteria bacterium]
FKRMMGNIFGYILVVVLSLSIAYRVSILFTSSLDHVRTKIKRAKEHFVPYVSSVLHGIGLFFCLLPLLLIGWYVLISGEYSDWFLKAPWPFSAFSSLGDQMILFLSLIILGAVFAGVGILLRASAFSQTQPSKKIAVVSLLRGVAVLSIIFPVVNEIYVEWLLSIPAPSGEPYSTEFSNLLKGPFPMSWYGSGLFLIYMYISAIIFGGGILGCAEVVRRKLRS